MAGRRRYARAFGVVCTGVISLGLPAITQGAQGASFARSNVVHLPATGSQAIRLQTDPAALAPAPIAPAPTSTTLPVAPVAVTTTVAPAQTPQQYLAYAISALDNYAYKKSTVDWPAIRAKAEASGATATSYEQTYPIIIEIVKALNDRHSSFTKPIQAVKQTAGKVESFGFLAAWPSRRVVSVASGGPADAAGLKVGDRIDKIDGKLPRSTGTTIVVPRDKNGQLPTRITMTWTRSGLRKQITKTLTIGDVTTVSIPQTAPVPSIPGVNAQSIGRIGYVDVPGIVGDLAAQEQFASQTQSQIRDLETATPRCGWVVDLRKNRGGYIHSMLAGLGPLTEGASGAGNPVGGKRNADGTVENWRYRDGVSFTNDRVEVKSPVVFALTNPAVPVAVLTSKLTASAGEAVTVAFRARAATRSFGEATLGIPTFNVRVRMSDGAFLDIMQAVDVDRAGNQYDAPVTPDEVINVDWANVGNANDPVLGAAVRWLSTQPGCA